MDIRQSGLWADYLQELGWKAEKISPNYFAYIRKLPAFGSIIKIPRAPLPIPFEGVDSLAKKNNALFVKLEPDIESNDVGANKLLLLLRKNSFKESSWSLNSSSTFQIDLTKSEENLLKNLEKDTRYSVNLAKRKGVRVEETSNLETFKQIYFDTAKRKGFWPAKTDLETLWKVLSKTSSAKILTAYYKNKPLATTLLLFSRKGYLGEPPMRYAKTPKLGSDRDRDEVSYRAYYYHAASLPIHREVMAPYLLLWEALLYGKKRGCKIFDLEGIKDPRYKSTKGWGGFTLFKKGFGGRKVEYLGSFTKYYKPWAKILFSISNF